MTKEDNLYYKLIKYFFELDKETESLHSVRELAGMLDTTRAKMTRAFRHLAEYTYIYRSKTESWKKNEVKHALNLPFVLEEDDQYYRFVSKDWIIDFDKVRCDEFFERFSIKSVEEITTATDVIWLMFAFYSEYNPSLEVVVYNVDGILWMHRTAYHRSQTTPIYQTKYTQHKDQIYSGGKL